MSRPMIAQRASAPKTTASAPSTMAVICRLAPIQSVNWLSGVPCRSSGGMTSIVRRSTPRQAVVLWEVVVMVALLRGCAPHHTPAPGSDDTPDRGDGCLASETRSAGEQPQRRPRARATTRPACRRARPRPGAPSPRRRRTPAPASRPARAPRPARRRPSAAASSRPAAWCCGGSSTCSASSISRCAAEPAAGAQRHHRLRLRQREPPRLLGRLGHRRVHGEEGARLRVRLGRLVRRPVEVQRLGRALAGEVVREDVGQALGRRPAGRSSRRSRATRSSGRSPPSASPAAAHADRRRPSRRRPGA